MLNTHTVLSSPIAVEIKKSIPNRVEALLFVIWKIIGIKDSVAVNLNKNDVR